MSGRNASLWAAAGELPDYDPDYSDACAACGSETQEHEADCPMLVVELSDEQIAENYSALDAAMRARDASDGERGEAA